MHRLLLSAFRALRMASRCAAWEIGPQPSNPIRNRRLSSLMMRYFSEVPGRISSGWAMPQLLWPGSASALGNLLKSNSGGGGQAGFTH